MNRSKKARASRPVANPAESLLGKLSEINESYRGKPLPCPDLDFVVEIYETPKPEIDMKACGVVK